LDPRELKLDQLRTFATVVAHGSFSAAAARLNLSQPAVSLQVRELERKLGLRLLDRVGKRAMPTAAGHDLLDHARQIEAAVTATVDAMTRHQEGTTGCVRIGTGATACIYLLPPVLRDLKQRFPGLEFAIRTRNILRDLAENTLDVGLVTLPVTGRMFDITPVLDDPFVAVTAADDDLPDPVRPAALAARPLVLHEARGNTRRLVDDWFARAGVTPTPVTDLDSAEAIKALVAAGLGCAVLPSTAVRMPEPHLAIATRRLSPPLKRRLALVLRRDKVLTAGLRETVQAIRGLGRPARRGKRGTGG